MDYRRGGTFYLAKWYPGSAWYSNRETNESFDEFLEKHWHDDEHAFWFRYES